MRVSVYARVSSAGQRDRHTIASQLREVPAALEAMGHEVVKTYVDDGKSAAAGKLEKRDAFASLCADAAAGLFEGVGVVDLDRITRTTDLRERGAILGVFQSSGVVVICTSTGQIIDYRTEMGDLMGSLGAYFAALENRKRRERFEAGKRTVALQGGKAQGETPYGLLYQKGDNKAGVPPAWSIDPARARIVTEIYTRVANGESTAAIANDLNRRGERRPRGGIWFDVQVRYVVTSLIYTGKMRAKRRAGAVIPVPAIVDADLADEARASLAARHRKPPPRTRHHHLLAGLSTCAGCGSTVGINSHSRNGTKTHYYVCLGRRYSAARAAHACELPMLRVEAVDALVWDALIDALATDAVVDRALGLAASPSDPGAIAKAEAELERIDGLQDAMLEMLARGTVSQAVADRQVERLGRDRRRVDEALRAARAEAAGLRPAVERRELVEAVRLMRADAEHMTAAERRELMRAAAGRVSVGADLIAIDLLVDARPVGLGDGVPRTTFAQRDHRIPAGRLRIATPPRRARRTA